MKKILLTVLTCFALQGAARAGDSLENGFANPPEQTKPWCYWYWISDNISTNGITHDLEAMARVGIGEALIGNVVDPDTPFGEVRIFTDAWWNAVQHAIREGGRLGVKIGLFNCPGWSQSGGPWVKPEQAMRYVASSETRVTGPAKFAQKLPAPKAQFQDIAVLAFPAPQDDQSALAACAPRVTCLPPVADAANLADGNLATTVKIPGGKAPVTIEIETAQPFTARSLALHPAKEACAADCVLEAADGTGKFRVVRAFRFDRSNMSTQVGFLPQAPVQVSFAPTTAKCFRLVLKNMTPKHGVALTEINLSGAARLEAFIEKQLAKMHPTPLPGWDTYLWPPPAEPDAAARVVPVDAVRDLSAQLAADGTLTWDVPAGEWIILRTGMTPTCVTNTPASPEGRGLEVDKMSRPAVTAHFQAMIGEVLRRMPAEQRTALHHVVIDSYEVGAQNWTDGLTEQFRAAFGYDPRPWLPVLTGRIVGSADRSERFLWDLRRLVADRVAYDYVGGLRDVSNQYGLRLWLENYGHWGFPAEFLQYGGQSDDVSGEFWVRDTVSAGLGSIELRAASSAAHLYGKPVVSAEAFTSPRSFLDYPANLKALGDWAYCQGINHFVLHVYIHQPWDDRKPGVNAWFGTEFNRHNTWFEQAQTWVAYLRRCHFLLQQGRSVADVAYFIGEDAPKMTGTQQPGLPPGYDFDYINAEVLLTQARVENGRLVLPSGASYRLLILPPQATMRPELLRKLRELVHAGAAILGTPPARSPSMQNYPACDDEVRRLVAELWGHCDGKLSTTRVFGQGRVFCGLDTAAALRQLAVPPAAILPKEILWTQRRADNAEIFFVSNQKNEAVLLEAALRVTGRTPEIWRADSGQIEQTAWFQTEAEHTRVPVALEAHGSAFIVFRQPLTTPSIVAVQKEGKPLTGACPISIERDPRGALLAHVAQSGAYQLTAATGQKITLHATLPDPLMVPGPWQVQFPADSGSAEKLDLAKLVLWNEHANNAVRHFSGTATYTTTFTLPPSALGKAQSKIHLDLGRVETLAAVTLNGHELGVLWKPPYTLDITAAAQPGTNMLQVKVTNNWWNRLAGDAQLPEPQRRTFTTAKPHTPRTNLLPSGLLGPVQLRTTLQLPVGL